MMTELVKKLQLSVERASTAFAEMLMATGEYQGVPEDIAIYYKHPMMWFSLKNGDRANVTLDHIKDKYLQETGDFFLEANTPKSKNPAYQEFYAYTNGWIVRSAKKCGREDVASSGLAYLTTLYQEKTGGFLTHSPEMNDGITDIITTAHLGLVHLESNRLKQAIGAGNYLHDALAQQPDLKRGFYLRRNAGGECIVEFPSEAAPIFIVHTSEPNQLYFMVAYPIAYLTELYRTTKDSKYLEDAKSYADFALSCHESVFACEFSHKLAWALSELYKELPEKRYLEAVKRIVDYFITIQEKDGLWFSDDPIKCFDQSAEIVCWFSAIENN